MANKDEFWQFVKAIKPQRTHVREDLRVKGIAKNRFYAYSTQRVANKDEFWQFVKAIKPQRTHVREDLRVKGSAKNRLVSHSLY